jgi:ABC-type phosphate transport system substrate-binding protein
MLQVAVFAQADWNKVTVVGNNTANPSLTRVQVTTIFKGGKARWKNDEDVIVVLPSSKHPDCEIMAATVFAKDMKFVKKHWLNLVFQGRANPPVYLDSNEEILSYVKKHAGAIGVLVNSDIPSDLKIPVRQPTE